MCAFLLASLPPEATHSAPVAGAQPSAGPALLDLPAGPGASLQHPDPASHPIWMFMDMVQRRAYVDEKVWAFSSPVSYAVLCTV